jgi:hypothetical protein
MLVLRRCINKPAEMLLIATVITTLLQHSVSVAMLDASALVNGDGAPIVDTVVQYTV